MFESLFRKIAGFSSRHSTAVIIGWIAALVVLAPASSLFLSNTSYDLTNSIVPANSMAQKASDLQSQYFSSSTGTGSNGSALIIVSSNTSTSTVSGSSGLLSLQENITSYLKTVKGFDNITSAYTLENSTLYSFSKGLKTELNSTYSLIHSLNVNITGLNESIKSVIGLVYGLPQLYLYNLSQSSSPNAAYAYTIAATQGNQTSEFYVNTFTNYFNNTFGTTPAYSNPLNAMNYSVNTTLQSPSSPFMYALKQNSPEFASLITSMNSNYTFLENTTTSQEPWNYVRNYTLSTFETQLSSQSSLTSFLNGSLNLTVKQFLDTIYTLGQPAPGAQIMNIMIPMITNGTAYTLKGSPVVTYNSNTLPGYLKRLNDTSNVSALTASELRMGSFSLYPVVPTDYVFHQFVGYDNKTTIMIATFSDNYTIGVVNKVTDISTNYTKGALPGSSYYVAGTAALTQQLSNEILGGMIKALGIGIALSVIIVGFFFRSPVAAFIPLAIFGFSTVLSMGINGLLYQYVFHASISFITPTLLLILLLGLTSDYVVYIMSRYRQEKRRGNPDAILDAGQWAGHAVFTSGITVALSYVVLWLSNIPIFSDSGLTNAIGVAISIMLANTFLIALLHKTDTKLYWPSNIKHAERFPLEKSMTRIADVVSRNKKKILVAFVIVSFVGSYIYLITPTDMNVYSLVPASSGIQALIVVNNSFHGDFFDRGYIIIHFPSPVVVNGVYNTTEMSQVTNVEKTLINHSEISQVYGPTFPYGQYVPTDLSGVPSSYHSTYRNQSSTFIGGPDNNYVSISFQLASLSWENKASNFVNGMPTMIDNALNTSGSTPASTSFYVGGQTQSLNDAYSYTSSTFLRMVPVLLIAIFIILLIQLSSLFTPLRLLTMVVSSVVVALSIAFLIIHYAQGNPILIFLPLFTFITLLAVGLDYDIFMVTRVREEVMKGKTNEEATKLSIKENGGVIVTLGMLLFVTFGALYLSGIGIMEEIGVGLALGVIVDTFISWPFFVPTIMMLMKKYNWWPSKMKENQGN